MGCEVPAAVGPSPCCLGNGARESNAMVYQFECTCSSSLTNCVTHPAKPVQALQALATDATPEGIAGFRAITEPFYVRRLGGIVRYLSDDGPRRSKGSSTGA